MYSLLHTQKPVAAIFMVTPTLGCLHTTYALALSQCGQILLRGLVPCRRTDHVSWMMVWAPIVPPRPQPLKRDMISLPFASLTNARFPLIQLGGLEQCE